jgi:glycosyltransferase involved in cell wall biosynthesis
LISAASDRVVTPGQPPRVSVIMPFKNRADLIDETIDSVLSQTWTDFELICISDGSTDDSDDIVSGYAARDARVRLLSNEMRPGVAGAANTGFAHARGEFVVRIDSDDIMLQNRIAVQVRFMDEHPEVAACGSWVQTFGEVDCTIWRLPVSHEEICVWMLFYGALANPAVIIRRQRFEELGLRYDEDFAAEDYELWTRAARKVRLANVPRILLRYRTHSANLSTTDRSRMMTGVRRVHKRQLHELGLTASADELDLHWCISAHKFEGTLEFRNRAAEWFGKLKAANATGGIFNRDQLERFLSAKLDEIRAAKTRFATLRRALKAILPANVTAALVRSVIATNHILRRTAACLRDRSLLVRAVVAVTPPILLLSVRRSYRMGKAVFRRATGRALQDRLPGKYKIGMAILIHERPQYLEVCLDTLFQTKLHDYDISFLLIDDGSQDPRVRELMEKPRDPQYKIVRRYASKTSNNWGAAFNRAIRELRRIGTFDVIGTSDSDALFHPDWLDRLMKVAIWAKANHAEHLLGPFSAFNSSDRDFHQWLGSYSSPHGDFVVKRRMGALNYLYFAKDLDRLDLFEEHEEDEAAMTATFDRLGVRNFSTATSYVEHIGQDSVLNQWRQRPVRRAVYGLNLAPAGWPRQLETAETLGYYREVKGSTAVGAAIWSDVPLDIVFVAADQDLEVLPLAVEGVRRNLRHPIADILIIAPADSQLRQLAAKKIGCRYVCEDEVLPIRKRDIKYMVKGVDRSGWLLQQFLKLGADALVGADRYLVVDADTILIKPQIFVAGGSDVLLHTEEYHHRYFSAYEYLVNLEVKTRVSAVAHQMLFNRSRVASLKSRMEQVGNAPWPMSIINAADLTDFSCFSEYETYGQWCVANYPEATHREFAFNQTLPRRLMSSVDVIMQQYARDWRSVSFHWYIEQTC